MEVDAITRILVGGSLYLSFNRRLLINY